LPKEIRVLEDLDNQREITEMLSKRSGGRAKITVVDPEDRRLSTAFALTEALSESEIDAAPAAGNTSRDRIRTKTSIRSFKISRRIEAFDVAHISASSFVAACSVAERAKLVTSEYYFQLSQEKSELATLAGSIRERISNQSKLPDLILVDGGRSQLTAALSALRESGKRIPLLAAVKPRSKHSEISRFIREDGEDVLFDPANPAHNLLKLLRDDAHDLSNRVHRDLRDMAHHYELAAMLPSINEAQRRTLLTAIGSLKKIAELDVKELSKMFEPETVARILEDLKRSRLGKSKPVLPLIVPLRFAAENGGAEDLRPIPSNR
jgi:excinuclease ABC subunit C